MSGNTSPAGSSSVLEVTIGDYRGTTFHKAIFSTSGNKKANTSGQTPAWASHALWRDTAAVNQISILQTFKAGSVVSLYGRM
jgi:hypothetical protein